MKSYTQLRNTYGVDTKNTSTANLTYGDEIMNDYHRRVLAKHDWPFLHRLRTALTVANTTFVPLPYDMDQVESVFVTVGATRYSPIAAPSRLFWDRLHYSTYSSDIPEYWFVYNGQLGLWPRPASAGNTISINGKIRVVDLNIADYTTGTIQTATQNDETIVGTGTTWVNTMVGRWLRITLDDTADSGDGLWYEIGSITNTTNLELIRKYGGNNIAAGTAPYTIGMMPLLPEAHQDIPELYGAYRYWAKELGGSSGRALEFKSMLTDSMTTLFETYISNDVSMVLEDEKDNDIINPNLLIKL